MRSKQVHDIVLMAFYLALFTVLDLITNALPLFRMPQGGTLGLSTIALLVASYQLGWKKGLVVSILSVFIQFVTGAMYILGPVQFVLDYLIAFGIYGIACLFPNFGWFYTGVLITNFIRFLSSTASGVLFYGVDLWGSIVYQAFYLVPTTILDLIVIPLLLKSLKIKPITGIASRDAKNRQKEKEKQAAKATS